MRVLILGITGFAGRYLAAELERSGHEVIGASRRAGEGGREAGGRRLLPCDITRPDQVASALATVRADAVVVLAGIASPPAAQRDPERAYRVHVLGTVHLLTAARSYPKLRILLITSSEAYGQVSPEELPVTEETPLQPASIYAASKASADLAGRAFALSEGMDVVRVRAFNHTGPGQRIDFVCPDFARQVAEIAAGRRSPRMEVGNLDTHRDFTDVRDIARGYVAALERGRGGEAYNLCSGRATLVKSILEDLCRIADVRPEIHVAASRQRRAEVPAYWGSFRKAESELGWRPEIPWEQTLSDLYHDARARLDAE